MILRRKVTADQTTPHLGDYLLSRERNGPLRRRWLLTILFLIYWSVLVAWEGVPDTAIPGYILDLLGFFGLDIVVEALLGLVGEPGSLRNSLFRIATSFISLDVLRHFPWIYLAWWVSFRAASNYLDDLLELNSRKLAATYLRSAVLGKPYLSLHIEGPKPDPKNILVRIGGPGRVHVNLEWTALFETIDNRPHVIGPGTTFISGFERLREVISIKDQLSVKNDIREFTKDGVPVTAQDVQVLFSIDRANEKPSFPDRPYPFFASAIRKIVYKQQVAEKEAMNWTDRFSRMITGEIRRFVSLRPLDEFLAEPPRLETFTTESQRRALTRSFHDPNTEIQKRIHELSNSLIWINVGTWSVPEEAVPSEHILTWKLSWLNRYRRQAAYREGLKNKARAESIRTLAAEFIDTYGKYPPGNPWKFEVPLFLTFRRQIHNALNDPLISEDLPDYFHDLVRYLDQSSTRWL